MKRRYEMSTRKDKLRNGLSVTDKSAKVSFARHSLISHLAIWTRLSEECLDVYDTGTSGMKYDCVIA